MDNQHRKIEGYRELTEEEIGQMNMIKNTAKLVGGMIDDLIHDGEWDDESLRWISIARTHMQQGFMAATRAVAKPEFF